MLHGTFVDSFKLRLTDLIYLIRSYMCIAKCMFRHLIFFNMACIFLKLYTARSVTLVVVTLAASCGNSVSTCLFH